MLLLINNPAPMPDDSTTEATKPERGRPEFFATEAGAVIRLSELRCTETRVEQTERRYAVLFQRTEKEVAAPRIALSDGDVKRLASLLTGANQLESRSAWRRHVGHVRSSDDHLGPLVIDQVEQRIARDHLRNVCRFALD